MWLHAWPFSSLDLSLSICKMATSRPNDLQVPRSSDVYHISSYSCAHTLNGFPRPSGAFFLMLSQPVAASSHLLALSAPPLHSGHNEVLFIL